MKQIRSSAPVLDARFGNRHLRVRGAGALVALVAIVGIVAIAWVYVEMHRARDIAVVTAGR